MIDIGLKKESYLSALTRVDKSLTCPHILYLGMKLVLLRYENWYDLGTELVQFRYEIGMT